MRNIDCTSLDQALRQSNKGALDTSPAKYVGRESCVTRPVGGAHSKQLLVLIQHTRIFISLTIHASVLVQLVVFRESGSRRSL